MNPNSERFMEDFWENKFSTGGAMWGFEPSDSAYYAVSIFKSNGAKSVLIPGMGYGRNAELFVKEGFDVTGIEISESAIKIARERGLNCVIHHGSVTSMPFDNCTYDGIFCYALIHVLNDRERIRFLRKCFKQLNENGIMVFVVTFTQNQLYGQGKSIGNNRFEISKGLKVFFYDDAAVEKEFSAYGIIEDNIIEEPVKFEKGYDPIILRLIVCKKQPEKN
jgi:SAM-dependent methyltransferase